MTPVSRHALACLVAVPVFGLAMLGCSGGGPETAQAAGTAGETAAFAAIQHSSVEVTVENRAGQALLDVVVAIKPAGRPAFTREIRRLENGEKRSIALNEFHGNDFSPYSINIARPREIIVTAVDVVGRKLQMTTRW